MPRHAANLGEEDTAKCKAAARNVNGAASNLFKAIFQFIEVESIRKKKQKTKKKQNAKWNGETNKTKQDKTRQNPCSVRAILVAGETRACYALSATWLAALDLTRRRLAKQIQIRRPTTKSSSVWPTTSPQPAPPSTLLPIQTKQAASLSP